MTIRVYISPDYYQVPKEADNGGIRRVAEAMMKYLPEFDVEVVHSPSNADVLCNHGTSQTTYGDVPIVNVNHGFYWSRQPWGDGFLEVNDQLFKSLRMAVAHTAPSEWVARAMRRGGFYYPEVVYHGVDADDFSPPTDDAQGYVLWNKARADLVSDPNDMMQLASRMPKVQFMSTIGTDGGNVRVVGVVPHDHMRELVRHAGVYLATARETFGIGTLEAMACGVPVAGWDWGGQSEIILPGITGYLAPPGDYAALAQCVNRCLNERDRLSANARDDIRARWKWQPRIEQYANLFRWASQKFNSQDRPRVSIIVTAYKLDQYLPDCLQSVRSQSYSSWECLVVDDAAQDSTEAIVNTFSASDNRFIYYRTPQNLGLPGARNFGFNRARGKYIRHLDADDYLAGEALELEVNALDADPSIHIVYGHLESVRADGSRVMQNGSPVRGNWPPPEFSWIQQMAHLNQLPSCCMMRAEVLERSGGYRTRMRRQEDAEFWCRVTSLGFHAKKVTEAVTYFHRQREDSKGALEWKNEGAEPDWTIMFPWRIGSKDYREAMTTLRKNGERHPNPYLVPFGAQGKCPISPAWPVHDYAYPVVSIIVTCGPKHEAYLLDALDSIQAQTFPDWECIVVNDTGKPWGKYIAGAPWAKVVNMDGNQGASAARNAGLPHVRGKYIIWLDADDYWMPWFLEVMLSWQQTNSGITYSDVIIDDGITKKLYTYPEFDENAVVHHMGYPGTSVLYPRNVIEALVRLQGCWDTNIPGMEDWDLQIAAHSLNFCAYHVPEPLFVYRKYSSTKRESDYARINDIVAYIDNKWSQYRKGQEKMCGCHKAHNPRATVQRGAASGVEVPGANVTEQGLAMVQVQYVGPIADTFPIRSIVDRSVHYRFANKPQENIRTVFAADAERFNSMLDAQGKPMWIILRPTQPVQDRNPEQVLGTPVTT